MNPLILSDLYFSGSCSNFSVLQTDSFTHYVERTVHPLFYSDLLCSDIFLYLVQEAERSSTGDPYGYPDIIGTTGGYKETKFHQVRKGVGVAHSTDRISRTTKP